MNNTKEKEEFKKDVQLLIKKYKAAGTIICLTRHMPDDDKYHQTLLAVVGEGHRIATAFLDIQTSILSSLKGEDTDARH